MSATSDPLDGLRTDRIRGRWKARYAAAVDGPWTRCHVVDLSLDGAGVELADDGVEPLGRIVIEIRPANRVKPIVVRGEVRNATTRMGRRRIGIQFVGMSALETRALTDLLSTLMQ